jgi:hypothetical protein
MAIEPEFVRLDQASNSDRDAIRNSDRTQTAELDAGNPKEKLANRTNKMNQTIFLYRPIGPKELELIRQSAFRGFPPRLSWQPIFYPVLNEAYATQIARDWNTKESGAGFVTRFEVCAEFLKKYTVQTVGGMVHQEYWIPAEDLAGFNQNIVGRIEVIAEFHR